MIDSKKPIITDSGENHPLIKRHWLSAFLLIITYGLIFYSRWRNWQIRVSFTHLWGEPPPSFPFFVDILIVIVVLIPLLILTGKAIGKMKIHVYDNCIEGYAFKTWGLLPRLHHFELRYDEILSVKKRKGWLSIRSTKGRYGVAAHNPEIIYCKIEQQRYDGGNGLH